MAKTYTQEQVDLVKMADKVSAIEKTVNSIDKKLESNYVTKDELRILEIQLNLVQKIVYGMVGLILTAVIGGVLAFFIGTPTNL